jgi:phage terminase Nu1 subunit (DNA packaging protein)
MPIDSLEAAIAWRESKSAGDSAERLRLARIALVNEQRERHQIENRVRRGELVEAGQVEADVMAMVSRARGEFLKLSSDLPPRLHGLDEAKMSLIIRAEIIEVLTRLSDETAALAALNPPVEK